MRVWFLRVLLIAFGLFIGLAVLEIALRISSGYAHREVSDRQVATPHSEGRYRILCLGESTTRGIGDNSWPKKLADRLEAAHPGRYEVINQGVPAVYSKAFAESIDRRLDLLRPSLVITMIGINDDYNLLVYRKPTEAESFADKFRVLRFFRLLLRDTEIAGGADTNAPTQRSAEIEEVLRSHNEIVAPTYEVVRDHAPPIQIPEPSVEGYSPAISWTEQVRILTGALERDPANVSVLVRLDDLYSSIGDGDSVIPILRRIAMLSVPQRSAQSAFRLGEILRDDRVDIPGAIEMFRRTLELDPNHGFALTSLALLLSHSPEGRGEAKLLLERAANLRPPRYIVSILLRDLLLSMDDPDGAERVMREGEVALLQSMRLREGGRGSCAEVVGFYGSIARQEEQLATLRECVELWPRDEQFLRNLGDWYFGKEEYAAAIAVFKRVAALPSMRERLEKQSDLEQFAISLMLESKRPGGVQKFLSQGDWVLPEVNPYTRENYRAIARAIRSRGIGHVAVQYPTLKLSTLQRTLAGEEGIEFVDNEMKFAKALREYSYDELFTDKFAGTFGHMTPLGHDILAESIQQVVVRMIP